MSLIPQPGARPVRDGSRLARRIVLGGACVGLTSALTLSGGLHASAETTKPTKAATDAGITAAGGGYAGWAMAQQQQNSAQPRLMAAAAASTPAGVPGIDVSSYQSGISWTKQWNNGVRFVYVKATEGTSYTNPAFSSQYTGSYKVGMTHGAYHFARPDSSSGSAQATYFVKHGGGWSKDGRTLPGALDIEQNYAGSRCYGNTDAQNVSWMKSFLAQYKKLTGRDAVIYSNSAFWSECLGGTKAFYNTNPLWLAYWSSKRPATYFGGWSYDTIWQYSGTDLDKDVFNGNASRLKALATGDSSAPASTPNKDSDGDGLTDAQEAKYGTSPTKKDTDGDGLTDKQEVTGFSLLHYGTVKTDPLKADTDGDGLSDKAEVTGIKIPGYGTVKPNPRSKDSDGDGLSDKTEVKTGTLVNLASPYRTYSSPNVKDTDKDGVLDKAEYAAHTSPRRKDTDGDGLSDKAELNGIKIPNYGTVKPNPLMKNSDGDGKLNDQAEVSTPVTVKVVGKAAYTSYSSPNRKDSDKDGVSDLTERSRGTDPLVKDTDKDGYSDKSDAAPLNPKRH